MYHKYHRKHHGQAQFIYLNAFINLIRQLGEITNIYQMCTINSHNIIVASNCSQQATIKISYHLNMYNILYKNDKLAKSVLVKIVNPIEKCQTTDYIFFLASYQCHNTVQKSAWPYVTYFSLYKFPQKIQFINRKIERKLMRIRKNVLLCWLCFSKKVENQIYKLTGPH